MSCNLKLGKLITWVVGSMYQNISTLKINITWLYCLWVYAVHLAFHMLNFARFSQSCVILLHYIFFWKNEMKMIKEYQGASNFLLFVHVHLSLGNQIIYYVEIKSPSPFIDVYLDELNLPLWATFAFVEITRSVLGWKIWLLKTFAHWAESYGQGFGTACLQFSGGRAALTSLPIRCCLPWWDDHDQRVSRLL